MKKKYLGKLATTLFLLILGASLTFSQLVLFDAEEKIWDTNGDTQGIAVQGYHVYLADGPRGLKIINVSNPNVFVLTGEFPLSGSFIAQVAVDEDVAVLTDTANNRIHFADIRDRMCPRLVGTLDVRGDVPRKVVATRDLAFVVEYGDDPSESDYFSGIEVFSYESEPVSTQLTEIEGVRDVVVTGKYVCAAVRDQLHVYERILSGFRTTPYRSINFSPGDNVNSLALYGNHLFAFGSDLYALPMLFIRVPGGFSPSPRIHEALIIFISDQISIPGDMENRRVDAAILDYGWRMGWGRMTSAPTIFVLLTTKRSCGMCTFDPLTNNLSPFNYIFDESSESWISMKEVYEATDHRIQIFDSAFSQYFAHGLLRGGILAYGALGEEGLGCIQVNRRR